MKPSMPEKCALEEKAQLKLTENNNKRKQTTFRAM